jgi:error-prone DNA polymerase
VKGTNSPAYAELQVTTNFSFLRGASHPEEMVAAAGGLGYRAIAITDRNTLAGVVRGYTALAETGAGAAGLRLIVGSRLDLADAPSLLCLPTDRAAYGRLSRLLTVGKRRAPKGECELALADVFDHAEGQVLVALPPDGTGAAIGLGFAEHLARLRDRLGRGLYLAAQHLYRGDDERRIANLAELAAATRVPLVATNDAHAHVARRRRLQDVLTCIREHCTIDEAGYRLHANAERHLKPPHEMARLFRRHPEAIAHTLEIAEACRFDLGELRYEYPDDEAPPGVTPQAELERLAWLGATERYPGTLPDKVRAQIVHELALIGRLGFAPYFLTVHDIVRFARGRGILCQGRGSAANSAVCYCLGVTAVDPARMDLLFERFVSAERREPPDIDVDFEHERREEVIQYIYGKYGRDRAGIAATVIHYRSRSAIREVGKALGLSQDTVAAISGTVWGWQSDGLETARIREIGLDPGDGRLALAVDLARELTGFPRHLSQHVGGFVITRGPLAEVVPIMNAAMDERTNIEWDKDDLDALGILKVDVLGLGMLTCIRKAFELLERHYGRKLTLADVPAEDPAVYDMLCGADSVGVFQVESRAQMTMLPRLRPRTFYDLVIEVAIVRPGPIQGDMVHPYLRRRDKKEPVDYPSEALRRVLEKTLGVPLFQEQAMQIAIVGAGFTPAESDLLRRAMATFRRVGTIHTLRRKFIDGMIGNGYTAEFAERCFKQIEGFGEYGFPESHAASFALLVYVSAWLKCHYPDAFGCAILNCQPMGFYAPAQLVRDARAHGVEVRPVDVNHSDWDCTLEEEEEEGWLAPPTPSPLDGGAIAHGGSRSVKYPTVIPGRVANRGPSRRASARQESLPRLADARICDAGSQSPRPLCERPSQMGPRFATRPGMTAFFSSPAPEGGQFIVRRALRLGFRQINGVAEAHAKALVAARDAGPPFADPADLWRRARIGRGALETLARADTFGSLGLSRRQALWAVRALPPKPLPLFVAGEVHDEPAVALPVMGLGEEVTHDYAALRLTLRAHPLALLRGRLAAEHVTTAAELAALPNGARVTVAGLAIVRQRPGTASGVIFITLEDETGIANLVVWPKMFERYRREVMAARLLRIAGEVQREGIVIHVVAERMEDLTDRLRGLAAPDIAVGRVDGFGAALARADHVKHPGHDTREDAARRLYPSRDFH